MQRRLSAEHLRRPVVGVVVHEGAAALHRVLHVGKRRRLAFVFVVLAADGQRDAVAGRHHDAGRPDLDVELDRRAGRERLLLVVVCQGRYGRESSASSLRCDARSQPWPTGVCGSSAPWNTTSFPCGSNTRSTTKRSASRVDEEMKSLSAEGPVISVSLRSGGVEKVTPSPMASYEMAFSEETDSFTKLKVLGSR